MRGLFAFAGRALALLPVAADALAAGDFDVGGPAPKGYALKDSAAIVNVSGPLSNRADFWSAGSYEEIHASLAAALSDPAARGIVLDIDSPGGDAAGAFELADFIRSVSAKKKVVAFVNGMACSAAYAIAAGASEIVAAPSATLGSIGVVAVHVDQSGALASRGLKPTLLHAGAFKIDGNSLQPLGAAASGRIQGLIDQVHGLFTATVGKHRPKLGEAGARRTEAAVYIGRQAVAAGLADQLGTMADAIGLATSRASTTSAAILSPPAARPASLTSDRTMTKPSQSPAAALSPTPAAQPAPAREMTSAEKGRLAFAQAAGISPTQVSVEMAAGQAAFAAAAAA